MWGKKKVYEHQDFPVYVGELPVGTEVTEMKWWYKGGMNQAEMLNERASQLELLKYKNKRFRAIIVDLKKKNDSLDLECEKYLDRIDRLKSALRERTLAYDSLQLRHMDLTTANENLKLNLENQVLKVHEDENIRFREFLNFKKRDSYNFKFKT